ncbi:MAG: hypothetical protein PVI30_07555 [Myxococcales bacterium]|jgi:hypothetical protein
MVVAALPLALLSGCAHSDMRTVLRAQFATELDCPEVQIQKRQLWYASKSPHQYKITGCGVVRTYTCPETDELVSYDEPQCTWVEGDADAPTINQPESDSAVDESMSDDVSSDDAFSSDDEEEDLDDEEYE